jgi:hypothetical protein
MNNLIAPRPIVQAPAIVTHRWFTPTPRRATRSWTWPELVAAEPRLLTVAQWAAKTRFSWTAYEALNARMEPFVGSFAQQPQSRTSAAWNAAGQYLLDCMQRGAKR